MVEVTQADREAAKRYFREADTSDVFHGTELAQAFARRRLSEREAVVKWLLSDAARLDYEASGSEEHFSWWAADQIKAGEPFK